MGNNSGWTFSVRNFRGCERADIVTAPIALIVGDGGASKSSVCQAIAAAVTGTTLPMPGITKAKAGMLLRNGTDKGLARVEGDDFTAEVSWPKAEYRTDGPAPVISRMRPDWRLSLISNPRNAALSCRNTSRRCRAAKI